VVDVVEGESDVTKEGIETNEGEKEPAKEDKDVV
jgi:hypothetical protein